MDVKTTGQIICENRKKKGLTQRSLANQLNVTDKAVSKWERDISRPDINTMPKLAEILDIPIEELMNIPFKPRVPDEIGQLSYESPAASNQVEEWDYQREVYKNKVRHLLVEGLFGFAGGFLFAMITSLPDSGDFNISIWLMVGLFTAGVPYGWELLGQIIGHWSVIGHIAIMIIIFTTKLAGALLLGWFVYPIALTYNLMKAQKARHKHKKVFTGMFILVIALIAAFLFIATGGLKRISGTESNSTSTAVTESDLDSGDTAETEQQESKAIQVDARHFTLSNPAYIALCDKAMALSHKQELASAEGGNSVTSPSEILGAYFLASKEIGTLHNAMWDEVACSNAVVIITSYEIDIVGIPRQYSLAWFFPDCYITADNALTYDMDNECSIRFQDSSLEKVYLELCEDYADMTITELAIP